MKKNQYTVPALSVYSFTTLDGLLTTASMNGQTMITDGGKASENNITTADAKASGYSVWDDDWSK